MCMCRRWVTVGNGRVTAAQEQVTRIHKIAVTHETNKQVGLGFSV